MQSDNDVQYAVLFVDDEEKTRKYFDRAFSREFPIFTASGVAAAREFLEERGDEIGVLISDQRMPEEKGVVLLRHARKYYPHIVRILTTAYSDLDDAIESVNTGEILRYITKPWDLKLLGSELRHAMRFFHLQQERDQLMREKISVQQRLAEVNRARDLIVMAGSFDQVRNPLQAIRSFLLQLPIENPAADIGSDRWELLEDQLGWVLKTARMIIDHTRNHDVAFEPVDIAQMWGEIESRLPGGYRVNASFTGKLPMINVQAPLIRRLLDLLLGLLREQRQNPDRVSGAVDIELSAAPLRGAGGSEEGVKLLLRNRGADLNQVAALSSSAALLAAFFIAYHHGGGLKVWDEEGVGFEFTLPLDGEGAELRPPESFWLDEIFARHE